MNTKKIKTINDEAEDENILNTYIREIDRIPLLTNDEEYTLAVKAKNGDMNAREKLITSNLRFVIKIAKEFQNRGLPLKDLISEGNIGLLTAIDKFEPELGNKFTTYAVWWIRQAVIKAIGDKARLIRLPMNRYAQLNSIQLAKATLEKQGEKADAANLAKLCNMTEEDVNSILNITNNIFSLDAPVNEDDDYSFGDVIEDKSMGPDEALLAKSLTQSIDDIMKMYSEREREIIRLRYGLHDTKPLSLKEIGELYGLSKERIRQIEKKILSKLSKDKNVSELKAYIA